MKCYLQYNPITGFIHSQVRAYSPPLHEFQVEADAAVDPYAYCVDVNTGEVIPYTYTPPEEEIVPYESSDTPKEGEVK